MPLLRRFTRSFAVLLGLAAVSCASTPVAPAPENPWSRIYLTDLDVARDTIAADHPGMVDDQNPAFRAAMDAAYKEARAAAPRVTGYDSYRVALTRFTNRFQDAHLAAVFNKPFETLRDAGIVTTFRGDAFVAEEVDARYGEQAAALQGATLVSCDGEKAREHFARRVLSWRGRPEIEADWYTLAPILFVDYGPPSTDPPTRCRFSTGGRTVDLKLTWAATTPERVSQLLDRDANDGRTLSVDREGDVVWVNIPTFSVNDEQSIARMNAMIEAFGREVKGRSDWRLVVFDLRGNSGGSSSWGRQLATHLFGEEWTRGASEWLGDGVYVEWRVSPDNVNAVEGNLRQDEKRHGVDSTAAQRTRRFHEILSASLARGEVLFSSPNARRGVAPPAPAPLPGRVVAITGASCFSACLDFVDVLRVHPGVVQVGQTTGVDTVYMESWGKGLPSGHARLSYPMKVYRNRRRGNNQAYVPAVPYRGALEDTEALRRWVLENYAKW